MINHTIINQRKAGMTVGFRARWNTRDKKRHYMVINGTIHKEDIAILYLYASNNRAAKCVKPKLVDWEINNRHIPNYTWRLQHPPLSTDGTTSCRTSEDTEELSNIINQENLINIHRIFHPKQQIHILFKHPQNIYQDRQYSGS